MTWRDALRTVATFRGVPFRTTEASIGVGRRNVLNEYPMRDEPYTDDLGRRARVYEVEGYVIGEDYLDQRDALIAALEVPGPGELVHPRYGTLWVSLHGEHVRFKESRQEGGIARFTAVFVEDTDNRQPAAATDTIAQIERTAEAADLASQAAYVDAVDVTGPQLLADLQAAAALVDINALMALARQYVDSSGLGGALAIAATARTAIFSLVRTPSAFVDMFLSLFDGLSVNIRFDNAPGEAAGQILGAAPGGVLNALQRLGAANRVDLAASTAYVQAQEASGVAPSTAGRARLNEIALASLQRRLVITTQARVLAIAITDEAVTTADQATTWRDQLVAQIDLELELADPDATTVRALSRLRAAVVRDVAERAEMLRQRSTFTSVAILPALVLAHRIYQDADRADELAQRNGVRHPAFVPAGTLEILL